jgi:hypothetical protein
MKTKIFGFVAIVCIAFAASFVANNVSKSSSALSMVAAANVEALAQHVMVEKTCPYDEAKWRVTKHPDGNGYNCTKGGSETCSGRK